MVLPNNTKFTLEGNLENKKIIFNKTIKESLSLKEG